MSLNDFEEKAFEPATADQINQNAANINMGIDDPNEAFRVDDTAKKTGLSHGLIREDPLFAKRKEQIDKFELGMITDLKDAPKSRDLLSTPEGFNKFFSNTKELSELEKASVTDKAIRDKERFGYTLADIESGEYINIINERESFFSKGLTSTSLSLVGSGLEMASMLQEGFAARGIEHDLMMGYKKPDDLVDRAEQAESRSKDLRAYRDLFLKSSEVSGRGMQKFTDIDGVESAYDWASGGAGQLIPTGTAWALGAISGGAPGAVAVGMMMNVPEIKISLDKVEEDEGIIIGETEKKAAALVGGTVASIFSASFDFAGLTKDAGAAIINKVSTAVAKRSALELAKGASVQSIAKGAGVVATQFLEEAVEEGIIMPAAEIAYSQKREFGDAQQLEQMIEGGALGVLGSSPTTVTSAVATNRRINQQDKAKAVAQFFGEKSQAVSYGDNLQRKFDAITKISEANPNATDSDKQDLLQDSYGQQGKSFIDAKVLTELAKENPEVLAAVGLDNITEENLTGLVEIEESFMMSRVNDETWALLKPHLKFDADVMSLADTEKVDEAVVSKHFDDLLADADDTVKRATGEADRISKQYQAEISRLTDQGADAGITAKAAQEITRAQTSALFSIVYPNNPEKAIEALGRLQITREGVVSDLTPEGVLVDPIGTRARIKDVEAKIKAFVKELRKKKKDLDAEDVDRGKVKRIISKSKKARSLSEADSIMGEILELSGITEEQLEEIETNLFDAADSIIRETDRIVDEAQAEADESEAFEQATQSVRKGAYFTDSSVIKLFKDADASTLPHEITHFWVDEMLAVIHDPAIATVDKSVALEILRTTSSWMRGSGRERALNLKADFEAEFGLDPVDEDKFFSQINAGGTSRLSTRVYQEMMAESFEVYLSEGKAPNEGMKGVFIKFASWIKDVYQNKILPLIASGELPQLNDEMRALFDGVLRYDQDVMAVQRQSELSSSALQSLGVTDQDQVKELMTLFRESHEKMVQNKYDLLNEASQRAKKDSKAIAESRYQSQPYAKLIKNVEDKGTIDTESARDEFGDSFDLINQQNKGMFEDGGRNIQDALKKLDTEDIIESSKSYETLEEMEARAFNEIKEKIHDETNVASVWTNPKLAKYEQALNDIIRGDRKPVSKVQMRRYAKGRLHGLPISDVNAFRYASIANNLAIKRATIVAGGKVDQDQLAEAIELGEKIQLNMAMAEVAAGIVSEHQKQQKSITKKTKKQKQVKKDVRSEVDGDRVLVKKGSFKYEEANHSMARLLANRYRLQKINNEDMKKAKKVTGGVEKIMDDATVQLGDEKYLNPQLFNADTVPLIDIGMQGKNFRDLSLAQIENLNLVISNILHTGDRSYEVIGVFGDKKYTPRTAFNLMRDEARTYRRRKSIPSDARMSWIRNQNRNISAASESLLWQLRKFAGLDLTENNTPFINSEYGVLSEAENVTNTEIDKRQKKLESVIKYFQNRVDALGAGRNGIIVIPELNSPVKEAINKGEGSKWKAQEVYMLAMHLGTEENYSKLIEGYGFTEAQFVGFMDKYITDKDMDNIQIMWDVMASMYDPANKVSKELNGVSIGKKEVRSFKFKGKEFKGGYAPATPNYNLLSETERVTLESSQQFNNGRYANTYQSDIDPSALKKLNINVKLPLMADFAMVTKHIEQMAKFTYLQPSLTYVKEIINTRDGDVSYFNLYSDVLGMESWEAHKAHLERMGDSSPSQKADVGKFMKSLDNASDYVAGRIRKSAFIINSMVRLVQPTAVIPIMDEVSNPIDWVKGMGHWKEVDFLSDYMAIRPDIAYSDIDKQVQGLEPSKMRKITGGIFSKLAGREVGGLTVREMEDFAVFGAITTMDNIAAKQSWAAKYAQGIRKHGDKEKARIQADEMIQRKWDSGRSIDKILSMEKKGVQGLFTMFGSYTLRVLYQNNAAAWSNLAHGEQKRWVRAANFMTFQVTNNILPYMAMELMRSFVKGEDLDEEKRDEIMVMSLISSIAGPIPYIGNALMNPRYPIFGAFDFGRRQSNQVLSAFKNGDNEDIAWAVAGFANTLYGVPVITAWKRAEKLFDRVTKD